MTRVEEVKHLFDKYAVDGAWDREHFELLLRQGDPLLTDDEVEARFQDADKNGDGKLPFDEFFKAVFDEERAVDSDAVTKHGLAEADVYVRFRPLGANADADGTEAELKTKLRTQGFDAESVTIKEAKGVVKYDFMREVILPDATQADAYRTCAAHYDEAVTMQLTDCMMLAYGQTGTGKTHSMLGTKESLKSDVEHEDWGIFPRLTHTVMKRLAAVRDDPENGCRYVLTVSAIEFYLSQALDLLDGKKPVVIDRNCDPVSAKQQEIEKVSDLEPFLETVNANKTTAATKMNAGSSRAHTALILHIHQYGTKNEEYAHNAFTLVDLAGAERTSKTGGKHFSGLEAFMEIAKCAKDGKPVDVGVEGTIINLELTMLVNEAKTATERHASKHKYKSPTGGTTDFLRFMGGCFEGRKRLGMLICATPSVANSGETWFSMNMGKGLAKLKVPLKMHKIKKFPKVLADARKAIAKAEADLAKCPEGHKFRSLREANVAATTQYVLLLEKIEAQIPEITAGADADAGSGAAAASEAAPAEE
jgi:hypothetical protein